MSEFGARAPLRISFGGGGTDLPSYYRRHGGFVVAAAIDRYVHMRVRLGGDRLRLSHIEREEVDDPAAVRHPILRAVLTDHWDGTALDLESSGDVPPGTGLGSSGAYTVCALNALAEARGERPTPQELAEEASRIEIDVLGRAVGKQDQYVAAHGGVCALEFGPGDTASVRPLDLPEGTVARLEHHFLLFYTGHARSASDMLAGQVARSLTGDASLDESLHRTRNLARETCAALELGDVHRCGELLNLTWEAKAERAPEAGSGRLAELRERALEAGAGGAMVMGAGGGGHLLVYAPDPDRVREALADADAPELRFSLEMSGSVGYRVMRERS